MDIQQFAARLREKADSSPLLQALQELQTRDLDQLRDELKRMSNWYIWPCETQAEKT